MSAEKAQSIFNRIPRAYYFFGIFCVLFVLLMVTVEINNGKFWTNDLVVYFGAAGDYFNGNNPYEHHYGLDTGFFKYAPTTLYFFFPTIWMDFFTVQMLHTLFLTISLVFSISILHFLFIYKEGKVKRFWLLYLAFAFIAIHVVREFHMGNVNLLLLFFFSVGLFYLKKGKDLQSAIFWSLMIVLKPIVILTFIPLLFFNKWKMVMWMAVCGICYFLLPVLFSGFNGLIPLWTNWLEAISAHGGYIVSENALKYLLEYYTGFQSEWGASIFFLVVLMGLMTWSRWKLKSVNLMAWTTAFLAFCPNFFVTDTEHFLLSLPLLIVIINSLIEAKNMFYWGVFILSILFFSFNANDLLGRQFSDALDAMGLLGITNLIFVAMFCVFEFKKGTLNSQKAVKQ